VSSHQQIIGHFGLQSVTCAGTDKKNQETKHTNNTYTMQKWP